MTDELRKNEIKEAVQNASPDQLREFVDWINELIVEQITEEENCSHRRHKFSTDGRCCPDCGKVIIDFGD